MKYDNFGVVHTTEEELFWLLHQNPNLNISLFSVDDPSQFNQATKLLHTDDTILKQYFSESIELEEFDTKYQAIWHMPDEYKKLDIAEWLLSQCKDQTELQRIGQELLLYQERNLFDLLRYLKYFVDTMRKNNVVWGLGRGSSVASYALYLLGVHKINSLYYDLDIAEFLKST